MGILLNIFKPLLKKKLLKELEREATRDYIIKLINDSMDVPGINETQEAVILDRAYEAAIKSIKTVIDRL